MSIFASTTPSVPGFPSCAWQPDVLALLDEQHIVACSDHDRSRNGFSASLQQFIGSQRDTDCCVLYGRFADDLDSFCHQLERVLPGPRLARRVHGPGGVADLLRSRQTFLGRAATKFRYIVWNDADTLLDRDPALFAELVETFAGVAAEWEYITDDMLLVQRLLVVGGPSLDAFASDPAGPMSVWRRDASGTSFWEIVTGQAQPRFARFDIDAQLGG